jgi:hypothetical protein
VELHAVNRLLRTSSQFTANRTGSFCINGRQFTANRTGSFCINGRQFTANRTGSFCINGRTVNNTQFT